MEHVPVLLDECIEGLAIKPNGVYVDGTLGRGGHSAEIAKRLVTGKLIAIDRDDAAIAEAAVTLAPYIDRLELVRGNFADVARILDERGIEAVDGMLFDLGVSSPQLDEAARGFSYMSDDAPLDMRMDRGQDLSAYEVINSWPEEELRRILYEYGEERNARLIARAIIRRRADRPISTTAELNEVIRAAMPAASLRERQHPSKRTYQAIRIAVNDELGAVRQMLETAPEKLVRGGRICIISFHSLEDRLVKTAFLSRENGCICPKNLPICACGFVPSLKVITKKPITPREDEQGRNPRARSAKLRVAERL